MWDLVSPMARAGVASGADGMIVEIHPDPLHAWSDGPQSLNEKHYLRMMKEVKIMTDAMKKNQRRECLELISLFLLNCCHFSVFDSLISYSLIIYETRRNEHESDGSL